MQATSEQIIALTKLQHIDIECARMRRELDGLPQKQKIVDIRKKKSAIQQKQRALVGMRKDAETQRVHAQGEDADLERKERDAQDAINHAGGDYRSIAMHSKELDGYAKRRATLADELSGLNAKLGEIRTLESEIEGMLASLSSKEDSYIASYQYEGGELLRAINEHAPEREALTAIIGPDIMALYERIAKAKNGIALAYLDGSACNTCRSSFDQSRVLGLRAEAPLTICPQCGRLMVVDKRYNG